MPRFETTLAEPAGVERRAWPVVNGVPFSQGEIRDISRVRLFDPAGTELPTHLTPLATWPDGSLRWGLLDTQINIGPAQRLHLSADTDGVATSPETSLRAVQQPGAVDVLTGALAARIPTEGHRLIASLSRGPGDHLQTETDSADLLAWVTDDDAPYAGVIQSTTVEEANPLRLCLLVQGDIRRDDDRLMGFSARLTFYAEHAFVRVQLTFVHDESTRDEINLRRLRLQLPTQLADTGRRALVGSAEGWRLMPAFDVDREQLTLTQWNIERHTVTHGSTRHDRRANAYGWLHVGDDNRGLTIKLRRPWQSYPKALSFDGQHLAVDLLPDLSSFEPPGQEPGRRWTEIDYASGVSHHAPLRIPQGMARTHELYLHATDPATDGRQVDAFTLAAEMPLLLQLPSERWGETGVLGPFPAFSESRWPLELKIRRFARAPNGRGIVNDGDEVRLETLADGTTITRTTENLAYELPRSLLRQYLRAGDQRLFWEGEAAVRHLMDVDTVHFSSQHPDWVGGPCFEWSQNHHYRDTDETELMGPRTSHTWLGSLLDYHFLTGCPRARQVARMCADYCRRAAPYSWKETMTQQAVDDAHGQPDWPWSTRVAGWALTGMGTYYQSFPEDRFLPAMESLVDLLEVWQDDDGRWRDQIGSHNRGATPFMMSGVLQGLQLYFEATGDRRARRMLLDGAGFLARQGRTREGIFYYKEAPISDNPHSSTVMCLPPLAWAFEQTGDPDLLDAGYRLFRWLVEEGGVATYMLKDLFAFMPLLERHGLLDEWSPVDARQAAADNRQTT